MPTYVNQQLAAMDSQNEQAALRPLLNALADRMSSQATSTAGLVIKAGGGVLAKTGAAAFAGVANGVPVAIAASTDMPALTGTITAAKYNVYCFFIDSASVVTVAQGTEGATLAAVKFPPFPVGKALVGYLVITYASTFTGNSTALDTATTVYVSPVGAFDPTILLSV
jgi:hypothetical protein